MTLLNATLAVLIGVTLRDILQEIVALFAYRLNAKKRKDYIDELLGSLAEPTKPE